MRRLILLSILFAALACQLSADVEAVWAVDLTDTANQVSVKLSNPSTYRVGPLPDGDGIRIVIPNAGAIRTAPQYRRLSHTIDYITAYANGRDAVIDIRTLGNLPLEHRMDSSGKNISVAVNYAFGQEPRQAFAKAPAAAKTAPKPAAKRAPATKAAKPAPQEEETFAETALDPDTLAIGDSLLGEVLIMLEDSTLTAVPATITKVKWYERYRPYFPALIALGLGLLALLLAVLIYQLLRKRRPRQVKPPAEPAPLGADYVADSHTRVRMVQKLLEQGWTPGEVAREMKLTEREMNQLLAFIKSGAYSDAD